MHLSKMWSVCVNQQTSPVLKYITELCTVFVCSIPVCDAAPPHTLPHTDIVLNTLNPDRAVEIITPGTCGCQWISLISDWPWCRKSSWGGRSLTPSTLALTSQDSTDRSHWLTTSSAPAAANTLESNGLHSTEVMGALCCLKLATGRPPCSPDRKDFGVKKWSAATFLSWAASIGSGGGFLLIKDNNGGFWYFYISNEKFTGIYFAGYTIQINNFINILNWQFWKCVKNFTFVD